MDRVTYHPDLVLVAASLHSVHQLSACSVFGHKDGREDDNEGEGGLP